jgi:transcriptional regulator with XRE-family HTH domain
MRYPEIMEKRRLGKHFLREWREYRGLSLRKFAELMQTGDGELLTSHANIGRVETLQQPYSQEILEAASEALGCSVTDLLTVDPTRGRPKISGERQVKEMLKQIDGLPEDAIHPLWKVMKGFLEDVESPEPTDPHGQSEPATHRREESPSR